MKTGVSLEKRGEKVLLQSICKESFLALRFERHYMCRKGKENLLYNALRLGFLGEVVLNLPTDAQLFSL